MSSPSRSDGAQEAERVAVIACGALSVDIAAICERRGWPVDIHPLPPLLHNRPELIAPAVEEQLAALAPRYRRIAIGYADCGTYGELDEVCARHGVARLPGAHCYDVYAGSDVIAELSAAEPGTYFLTDFLAAGFERLVWRELGLDRYPDLRDDYFRHYTRVVWLATRRTADLERAATRAAERLGLPLVVRDVAPATGPPPARPSARTRPLARTRPSGASSPPSPPSSPVERSLVARSAAVEGATSDRSTKGSGRDRGGAGAGAGN